MGIIYLHGLRCEGTVGVWAWEKAIKQTLVLDIDLATDVDKAAKSDDLKDALDYQAVTERIQSFTSEGTFELIETLAERIASLIIEEFSVPWVRVKLDKGSAVKGVKHVGVIVEQGNRTV